MIIKDAGVGAKPVDFKTATTTKVDKKSGRSEKVSSGGAKVTAIEPLANLLSFIQTIKIS